MKRYSIEKVLRVGVLCTFTLLLYISCKMMGTTSEEIQINVDNPGNLEAAWQEAETTALGKYPELITYTLGKVIGDHNSNMPEGDTYEDNNYTRYLRELLNVQNVDVMEGVNHTQYTQLLQMSISENELPDIMVVTDQQLLDELVANDMIEDPQRYMKTAPVTE